MIEGISERLCVIVNGKIARQPLTVKLHRGDLLQAIRRLDKGYDNIGEGDDIKETSTTLTKEIIRGWESVQNITYLERIGDA